ncbi:hypothetical protein NsoK4_07325 [Nitrosopumilus sp. K4]|uniref:hypothetical protein n=1 Tax=Nitrosopumilus sp. K4 TaxID=2795383 RepID=UPI001BA9E980|nr:hypothetical protein [Nitrosopumilus sp. K4]QUC64244.1 hypothetical protein NsoK4_07325 [Nitrosopumilus sp. K4]
MDYKKNIPIVVFDNQCYLCIKFAKIINFFAKGKFSIIGHYSKTGEAIRKEILDDSALDMFWFIDEKNAYGGRAALIPLLKSMITSKNKQRGHVINEEDCGEECKNPKAVFLRSTSLLSNSKTIKIH